MVLFKFCRQFWFSWSIECKSKKEEEKNIYEDCWM